MNRVISFCIIIVGALFVLIGVTQLIRSTDKLSAFLPLSFGILLLFIVFFPILVPLSSHFICKLLHRLVCVAVILYIIVGIAIICTMLFETDEYQGQNFEGTVIVLGNRVTDDQPGVVLQGRLDKAITFLNNNPNATCILSGGKSNATCSPEADVMESYLISHGIDRTRITKEDQSLNTKENLQNSLPLTTSSKEVVIITNTFHQYRAQYYARQQGAVDVKGIDVRAPIGFAVTNWMREIVAIPIMWMNH